MKTYKPTRSDVEWFNNFTAMLNDGATWVVPRSGNVYRIERTHKRITRIGMPLFREDSIKQVALAAGWLYIGIGEET